MTKKNKFLKCFNKIFQDSTLYSKYELNNDFLNKVALLADNKFNLNWCANPENQEAWFEALEEFKNESFK
jgi:hypothetical protein